MYDIAGVHDVLTFEMLVASKVNVDTWSLWDNVYIQYMSVPSL